MNHAGDIKPDMLVILNDNEMSISENVGALNNHLAQLLSGKLYSSLREGGKESSPAYRRSKSCLKRTEEHIKGMVVPGTLFEELGFNYIGPVDGHDVLGLVTTLKNMRDLKGPSVPAYHDQKGRGYEPAEKDPITFHAVPVRPYPAAACRKAAAGCRATQKNFWRLVVRNGGERQHADGGDAVMREGSGMVEFLFQKIPGPVLTSPLPSNTR